eukprot:c26446_g1_i1.p3 GENE.c26446_g1_i1~~c26446_g1_i1.p3  ORF type:complete len:122 (+),score=18.58 c26446_g1_i1:123-488(+)
METMPNTYQLGPAEGQKFNADDVRRMLEETIDGYFASKAYDPAQVSRWTVEITRVVEEKVRAFGYPRYKHVVHAVVGQNHQQGVDAVSRCLWSIETDTWTSKTFRNDSLFVVVSVFGLYLE